VLREIALAEGRPHDAMTLSHESDCAADGLSATRWAACVFPRLAESYALAGDAAKAGEYRAKLEMLWTNADAAVRQQN